MDYSLSQYLNFLVICKEKNMSVKKISKSLIKSGNRKMKGFNCLALKPDSYYKLGFALWSDKNSNVRQ